MATKGEIVLSDLSDIGSLLLEGLRAQGRLPDAWSGEEVRVSSCAELLTGNVTITLTHIPSRAPLKAVPALPNVIPFPRRR